jgi:hypothetical protein
VKNSRPSGAKASAQGMCNPEATTSTCGVASGEAGVAEGVAASLGVAVTVGVAPGRGGAGVHVGAERDGRAVDRGVGVARWVGAGAAAEGGAALGVVRRVASPGPLAQAASSMVISRANTLRAVTTRIPTSLRLPRSLQIPDGHNDRSRRCGRRGSRTRSRGILRERRELASVTQQSRLTYSIEARIMRARTHDPPAPLHRSAGWYPQGGASWNRQRVKTRTHL